MTPGAESSDAVDSCRHPLDLVDRGAWPACPSWCWDNHIEFNGGFGVANGIPAGPATLGRHKINRNTAGTISGGFLQVQPNECNSDLVCP